MDEYIEREALIEIFRSPGSLFVYGEQTVNAIISRIKMQPAADIAEMKRGTWVGEADGYADGELVYDVWFCSECNYCIEEDEPKYLPNFCAHCGAKMEVKE